MAPTPHSALVPSSVHVIPGKSSLTPPHLNSHVQNVQRPSSLSSLPPGPNTNTGTSASGSTTSATNTAIGKSGPGTTTATAIAATNPNNVIRPTTVSTGLKKMGAVETESVKGLSIVLEGVNGDIPDSTLTLIQTVLEEHSDTVVNRVFPTIHFRSTIRISLASPNNKTRKRNLRLLLDQQQQQEALQQQPSVTIQYNELIEFQRLYGMEDLNAMTLASLPLETPHDREEFVNKIHNKLNETENDDDPFLQSIVGVSMVELPPTISPSSSPTSTSTLAPTTRPATNKIMMEEEEEEIQKVPIEWSMIIVYFCLGSTGVALVVSAIRAIVKRKKHMQTLSENL